ncbi:hypothetical protein ACI2JA_08245 [Alkalihalobacillus sp. NPDC078783]
MQLEGSLKRILLFLTLLLTIALIPILVLIYSFQNPEQYTLEHSYSPNNINEIEVIQIADFPDPIFEIKYGEDTIEFTKLRGDLSIHWEDDYNAFVRLDRPVGEEPHVFILTFD